MLGLDKIVSNSRQILKNAENKIRNGIKSLESEIGKYTEKGINRTREYAETINKYVINIENNIKHGIESLKTRIGEYVETAKYVIPSALISSNIYGRMGFVGSMLLIHSISRGGTGGGWYSKIPTIVGTTFSILALVMGLYSLHLDQVLQHQLQVTEDNYNTTITQIQKQLLEINDTITQLQQNLNNMDSSYNTTITQIYQQLQEINATITQLQNDYQISQQEIKTLMDKCRLYNNISNFGKLYTLEIY